MKAVEDKIIEEIYNYQTKNGYSGSVILIHDETFENLLIEIKEKYSFDSANIYIEPNTFRYMGLRVCRTKDIDICCIEVY